LVITWHKFNIYMLRFIKTYRCLIFIRTNFVSHDSNDSFIFLLTYFLWRRFNWYFIEMYIRCQKCRTKCRAIILFCWLIHTIVINRFCECCVRLRVKESEKRRKPGRGHRVMAKQSQGKLLSLALLFAELIIYNYLSAVLFF